MRNLNTKLSIFVLLLCTILIGWLDPASDKNEEGIRLYNEEKHDEAISKFTDAQSYVPESQSLDFNIANTHYKEGKFPEAEKSFKNAIKTKDNTLKAKANYNMGNTMYKQGKFKEALDFYKKTIELTEKEKGNLKDEETASIREDAKYNYEFVQKKMEEMQKEQQERQEQEKDNQEQQDQQEQQQEQENDKQQSEEKDSDQQEQQDNQAKGEKKEPSQENKMEEPPPLSHEKREMTKEEAERILEAMKQAEMAARDSKEKERKAAQFSIEKDW